MQIYPFKLVCQSRASTGTLQGFMQEHKVVLKKVASVLLSEPAHLKHGAASTFFQQRCKMKCPIACNKSRYHVGFAERHGQLQSSYLPMALNAAAGRGVRHDFRSPGDRIAPSNSGELKPKEGRGEGREGGSNSQRKFSFNQLIIYISLYKSELSISIQANVYDSQFVK